MAEPEQVSRFEAVSLRVSSWIAAVKNFGTLAAGIAVFIGAISWYLAGSDVPRWLSYAATAVCAFSFALPCGALLHRHFFRRKEIPLGYRWKDADLTRKYDSEDCHHQTQDLTVHLQSRRSNQTIFMNKLFPNGIGSESGPAIKLMSPDQILYIPPRLGRDGSQLYYVHFQKPLQFGEMAEVKLKQIILDGKGDFQSNLSKHVHENMEFLTLRVLFGSHLPPRQKINAVIRSSAMGEDRILKYGKLDYDEATRSVKYSIKSPRKGATYAIEWDWE